jgi:hypothetical protein
MTEIKNTRDLVSPGWGFMLLSCILIPGDELVWRCILLLPLCAYFNGASGIARGKVRRGNGSFGLLSGEVEEEGGEDESPSSKSRRRDLGVLACLLSSVGWALAHKLFFDTWVVGFAAFTMGVMWSGFFLRTRSLYAVIMTHLIWDTLTVYILPIF